MKINNNNKLQSLNLKDLHKFLNRLEKLNFDDCLSASLHGSYSEVNFHKGFYACLCCLKDYYKLKKDVDIYNIMMYL